MPLRSLSRSMAPITTRSERTLQLPTDLGPITVLFNDDADAYVRFGEQPGGSEPDLPPLKLPRGILLRGSSHYRRVLDERTAQPTGNWRPAGSHATAYEYFYRQDSNADATHKQRLTARDAIIDALNAWTATDTGRGMLEHLAVLVAHEHAAEYRGKAAELRGLAEKCVAYAEALEAGGRLQYRTRMLAPGGSHSESVRMVLLARCANAENADAYWLDPLPDVAMPYGTTKHDSRNPVHKESVS